MFESRGLPRVPKKAVSISDLTLSYLGHVEDADTKADVVKDAICVLCVQLVYESLFWRETELGGVYWNLVLLYR